MTISAWALCLGLGLVCLGIFARGILRDHHIGEPTLSIDLSRSSPWQTASFRLWGEDSYTLYLTTVNHAPPFQVPFRGTLEVKITDPRGGTLLHEVYTADRIEHVRPRNMHWTELTDLVLQDRPWRTWALQARVRHPDPRFAGTSSRILLRKVRPTVGMEGMVNYVMIYPAVFLLALALLLSIRMRRATGRRLPLWISGILLIFALMLLNGSFLALLT